MVATVATCKGVQHGATIYHKCHCYMVLHNATQVSQETSQETSVGFRNNGRIFPHPGGQAVIVHGPHSSIYQSISVSISIYVFFYELLSILWASR